MKRCPLCAEEIQDAAIKCRFCGGREVAATGGNSVSRWLPPDPPPVSGMAVASLVLGILWTYWVGSITALILGYLAKKEIDREPGRLSGRGLAQAGIVLGWVGVATLVIIIGILIAGISLSET